MNKGLKEGKKVLTPQISKDLKTQRDMKKQNKVRNKVIKLQEQAEHKDWGDKGKICTE